MLKGVTPSGRRERFIEPDKGRILSEICPVVNSPIEMSGITSRPARVSGIKYRFFVYRRKMLR